ncbi:hypothetical protein [Agarivorans sp. Z349TD_8]|uniref:hypothetical protein n=1 Tax=Agarivorans sp. Z349TD_8 TaxID=3421434 RepID=UPI003D7EB1D6
MLSVWFVILSLFVVAVIPIPAIIRARRGVAQQQRAKYQRLILSLDRNLRRHWRLQAQQLAQSRLPSVALASTKQQIDETLVLLNTKINNQYYEEFNDLMLHWHKLNQRQQLPQLRYHHQQMLRLCQDSLNHALK